MPEIQEKFVSVRGCRLRYLVSGVGPPLVLIHGLLGYSFCFRRNIATLSEKNTVLALDLPGTGFSDRPPQVNGSLTFLARVVSEFCHAVDARQPVLLGSSHGGAIALLAANIAGEVGINIRSLILVAPVNPWSRNGGRLAALAGSGLGAAAIRALSPCLTPLHGYFLRRMYGERARLTRDSVEGYSRAFKQRGSMAHLLGRVKDWPAMLAATEQALPACSKLPVFIIWGERDRAVDPQSAQPLLERLACAELAIMKGAGHLPFEEQPEEFNALVSGFLARQAERVYS